MYMFEMLFSITPDTNRSKVVLIVLDQFNFVTGVDINKPVSQRLTAIGYSYVHAYS